MHATSDLSSRSDECVSEPPIGAASVSAPVRLVSTAANLLKSVYDHFSSEPLEVNFTLPDDNDDLHCALSLKPSVI